MADEISSEELLSKMVDALNRYGANSPQYKELERQLNQLTLTGKASAAALSGLKGAAGGAATSLKATGKELSNLGKTAATAGATLENVVDAAAGALGAIPIVGGALGGAFKLLASQTQFTVKALGDLSDIGALGAQGMKGFKDQFELTGVSMQTWHDTLLKNSSSLANFAGNASAGAERLADITRLITTSAAGEELRNLGMSSNEMVEMQSSYMRQQTLLGRSQRMTNEQLAKGTHGYLVELDELARLTGMSRKEQAKLHEEAMTHAQYAATMAKMEAEGNKAGAQSMRDMLTVMASIGPEAKEEYMAVISGMGPVTEAGEKFFLKFGAAGQEFVNKVKAGGNAAELFHTYIKPRIEQLGPVMDAYGMINEQALGSVAESIKIRGMEMSKTKEVIDQQDKSKQANADAAKITEDLNRVNNKLQQALIAFEPVMNTLLTKMTGGLGTIAETIASKIQEIDTFSKRTGVDFLTAMFSGLLEELQWRISDGIEFALRSVLPDWVTKSSNAAGQSRTGAFVDRSAGLLKDTFDVFNPWGTDDSGNSGVGNKLTDLSNTLGGLTSSIYWGSDEFKEYSEEERDRNKQQIRHQQKMEREARLVDEHNKKMAKMQEDAKKSAELGGKTASSATTGSKSAGGSSNVVTYTDEKGNKFNKEGGHINWRNNNPGNIRAGKFANSHGAIGENGGFAIFPSMDIGRAAQESLLKGDTYKDLSILDAIKKYAPASDNNRPIEYANQLAKAVGVDVNTKLSELNSTQFSTFLTAQANIEGGKEGTIASLDSGGLVSGNINGFMAMLHGDEQVIPVNGGKFPAPFEQAFTDVLKQMTPPELQNLAPQFEKLNAAVNNTNSQFSQQLSLLTKQVSLMQEMIDKMGDVATHTKKTATAVS